VSHCNALEVCSLNDVYLFILFPLNNTVAQAASQWVLCFSGSLSNVLYWFGCDCLFCVFGK